MSQSEATDIFVGEGGAMAVGAAVAEPTTMSSDVSPAGWQRSSGAGVCQLLSRIAVWCVAITLMGAALLAGARLRVWAWEVTQIMPPGDRSGAKSTLAARGAAAAAPAGGRAPRGGRYGPGLGPGGAPVGVAGRPQPPPGYGHMGGLRSGDVNNGYTWGSKVYNAAGSSQAVDWRGHRDPSSWRDFFKAYLAFYDNIETTAEDGKYQLDYGPGRLLTMALWVRHTHVVYPHLETWQPAYAFTAPLLRFNTCCELLASIAAFLLVEHWVRRGKQPDPLPGRMPGLLKDSGAIVLGSLAALLLWFSPATLVDAHVWPQWDVWAMPFYLWALYLGSVRTWFFAGAVLGVGIMFKGQLLFGVPMLILWPLFGRKPLAAWPCLAGFLSAVALVVCGWLVDGSQAWLWLGTVMATCTWLALSISAAAGATGSGAVAPAAAGDQLPQKRGKMILWLAPLIGAAIVLWPWLRHDRPRPIQMLAPLGIILLTTLGATLSSRGKPTADRPRPPTGAWLVALCCFFAAGVFGAGWIFHGRMGWFELGFSYGTYKHLAMSNSSSNLPALLNLPPYGWDLQDVVFTLNIHWLHVHWPVPMRTLLGLTFFLTLLLFCLSAAIKDRRNDPSILIAFVAPWVLLFAVMPQMHQRYFMWPAAFSAVLVGVSLRMTLIHLLMSGLAAAMILRQLLTNQSSFAPELAHALSGVHPASGWMVAVIAGIFTYTALGTRRASGAGL